MDGLKIANRVFETEIEALNSVKNDLDSTFNQILDLIMKCRGKVIITGMGKSGHIGRKVAASMASLGISSFFLHPGEAMHGDLGMIQKDDVIIAISYSGESDEIKRIIPSIRIIGAKLVGITSNPDSTLARESMVAQVFPNIKEACHLGLAPTTSTTVVLVYCDALAVAASELQGFNKRDFGIFHPAGSLGKRLTIRSIDLMKRVNNADVLKVDSTVKDALLALSHTGSEIIAVCDESSRLCGIITNGDIERYLTQNQDIYEQKITEMINRFPVFVNDDSMAIDALAVMKENGIKALPVVKEERIVGILEQQVIVDAGIYI